jgi:hypothetical protein
LILQEKGFQIRDEKIWEVTEKGKKFADFVQNKSKTSEKTVYHLTWQKGKISQPLLSPRLERSETERSLLFL